MSIRATYKHLYDRGVVTETEYRSLLYSLEGWCDIKCAPLDGTTIWVRFSANTVRRAYWHDGTIPAGALDLSLSKEGWRSLPNRWGHALPLIGNPVQWQPY